MTKNENCYAHEDTTTTPSQVEYLTQDEVRQSCSDFITSTRMTNRTFSRKIGLSPEGYYNWMSGESNVRPETMIRILEYLGSQEARELLEERKVYKPVDVCAQLTRLSEYKIKDLCKNGVIDARRDKGGHWLPNIEELQRYADVHNTEPAFKSIPSPQMLAFGSLCFDPKVSWQPVLSAHNSNEMFKPERYEFNDPIIISSNGKLFNCRTRNLIADDPDQDDYIHANLPKKDEDVTVYIHRMVAYFFCPNERRADATEVHHVNGRKHDNRACNLLWCTPEEHDECHRLMKKSNKKAYREYVKKIRKANRGITGAEKKETNG